MKQYKVVCSVCGAEKTEFRYERLERAEQVVEKRDWEYCETCENVVQLTTTSVQETYPA